MTYGMVYVYVRVGMKVSTVSEVRYIFISIYLSVYLSIDLVSGCVSSEKHTQSQACFLTSRLAFFLKPRVKGALCA